MTKKRILVATDVPFWRQSTGAQQRINSIVRSLHNQDVSFEVFYVAGADSRKLASEIGRLEGQVWLENRIKFHSSSDPPESFFSHVVWRLKGTWNWLFSRSQSNRDSHDGMRLEDFEWPWARNAFGRRLKRFQPDVVIVEYVKLAYLLSAPELARNARVPLTILDSHDLLHKRYESFAARGEKHWIAINEQEEAGVFERFDVVMAIQELEAIKIKQMAPEVGVIVCSHACYQNGTHPDASQFLLPNQGKLRLGILSSNNPANRSAIENFVSNIWAPYFSSQQDVQLLIAGSVCEGAFASSRPSIENICWERQLDTPSAFYRRVDVVVNPIEFGSGLKIKNVEALAHGKPLITTSHGGTGFVDGPTEGVFIADTAEHWRRVIGQLANPSELDRCRRAALELAKERFSEATAYAQLIGTIENIDR